MTTFMRSQKLLVSVGIAALGGAALLKLSVGNIFAPAGAGATALDVSSPFVGAEFPVCHSPAATGLPKMVLRLAQTEVPRRDFAGAAAAADSIETIERTADFKLLKESNVPAQEVLRIARTLVLARVAQANGDNRTAIVRFERAAALQDALPYTEPPYWYYPIRQSLAAALLQAGRYAEAERQFQRALSRAPSNGWSYYGLAELYKARGNIVAARKAEADLAKTWIGDRGLLQISNL